MWGTIHEACGASWKDRLVTSTDISVVLCTYNGEKYLPELLDSLLEQTLLPSELVWRDDRSTDATPQIAAAFAERAPFPVNFAVNPDNLGPMQNFGHAMSHATGALIAPSDQDDVWLPNKLELLARHFEGDDTRMVYSDSLLVDSKLESLGQTFLEQRRLFHADKDSLEHLLFQNTVSGCVSLFDAKLLQIALPIPERAIMHDWWITLVAAAMGDVRHIPETTTLYRQHEGNVLGSPDRLSLSSLSESGLPFGAWRKAGDAFARSANQAIALRQRLDETNSATPAVLGELTSGLAGSRSDVWKLCRRAGIQRGELMRNLYFKLGLLAYRPADLIRDE